VDKYTAVWNYPTTIYFGAGRLNDIASCCTIINAKNPLLVSDRFLSEQPCFQQIIDILKKNTIHHGVYLDVAANPTLVNVLNGLKQFRDHKHDAVICFGGGSVLDAGKAIALMAKQTHELWEFEDKGDNYLKVNTKGIAPSIAIPTASGTGAEVGRVAVILDEEQKRKKLIFHPDLIANIVIADPELTFSLPAHLTAATGLDAFTHNLEAYCSPAYHPMADGISIDAMMKIFNYLPIAYTMPNNLEARTHMLSASIMGATAFQKGLGAVHALAHPLGAHYGKHHGLLNAVLLPYVLQHNLPAIEHKLEFLCKIFSLPNPSGATFIDWIVKLRHELEIPNTLSDIGIPITDLDLISNEAFLDASSATNPTIWSVEDYHQVLNRAITG
jgi:alcohol dehydrogenase class IV